MRTGNDARNADRHGAGVGRTSTQDRPRPRLKSSTVRDGCPAIRAHRLYAPRWSTGLLGEQRRQLDGMADATRWGECFTGRDARCPLVSLIRAVGHSSPAFPAPGGDAVIQVPAGWRCSVWLGTPGAGRSSWSRSGAPRHDRLTPRLPGMPHALGIPLRAHRRTPVLARDAQMARKGGGDASNHSRR
jgi:hypothetical protein